MAETSGKYNGTLERIAILDSATYELVAFITSLSDDLSVAMIDVSNADSAGHREILPGLISESHKVDGFVVRDEASTLQNYDQLYAAAQARTKLTIRRNIYTSAGIPNVGDTYYQRDVYISSLSKTSEMEGAVKFSATLEVTGTPSTGVNA